MRMIGLFLILSMFAGCDRITRTAAIKTPAPAPAPVPVELSVEIEQLDPAQAAKALAAFAKEIEAMKPVAPVACEKLEPLLPKAPAGYTAGKPMSETISFEASVSSGEEPYTIKYNFVELKYKSGEKTLTVRIIDVAQNGSFYKWIPEAAELKGATDEGHEMGLVLNGDFAMETYRKASQRGELKVMVAKRFEIEIVASGVEPAFVQTVLKSIDRKALAALK